MADGQMPGAPRPTAIHVDRAQCMGSGMCIMYAANTFAHDDETKAVVIDIDGDSLEALHNAVEACPTGALALVYESEGV
ncbi:MAG: ferredoxin [Actinomycetota bacterium]|nr:ferredoxin [Actinomycetota bacterium]